MIGVPLWRVRAAAGLLRWSGRDTVVGRRHAGGDVPAAHAVHAPLDALLGKYVDAQGLVDYAAWRRDAGDCARLDTYLAGLGSVGPARAGPLPARLAFWINAYNALMISSVLRDAAGGCPCRQRNRLVRFNPWRDVRLWVGGRLVSLDAIEHRELRPLGEPRVHFALVCGARGCPPLRASAYAADDLDAQLADNTRRFLARADAFRADPATRTVRLSPLLKWYGRDFGRTTAERLRAWRPYLPAGESHDWLDAGDVRLRYGTYDWSLNERAGPGCAVFP